MAKLAVAAAVLVLLSASTIRADERLFEARKASVISQKNQLAASVHILVNSIENYLMGLAANNLEYAELYYDAERCGVPPQHEPIRGYGVDSVVIRLDGYSAQSASVIANVRTMRGEEIAMAIEWVRHDGGPWALACPTR